MSDDGDPVDVLVITPLPLISGAVIEARPIGVLKMTDESGVDYKILAVPIDRLTPLYKNINLRMVFPSFLFALKLKTVFL